MTPDDRFLNEQRREPDPAFARTLRERLRGDEDDAPARGFRFVPALASAAGIALIALAFTVPAVRVAAQNALDLFRVRSFAAVEIDEGRMDQLMKLHDQMEADPSTALFEKQGVLKDPGKPVEYPTPELAGSAAGLPGLHTPRALPAGMKLEHVAVTGEGQARLVVRVERVRKLIEALGLTDVQVPTYLDGQTIAVRMPHAVTQQYGDGKRHVNLVEGTSPDVSLPPGADLRQLGEIGLRVLGLDAGEARRVAGSIDWKSTLVVPVPASAESFRQVDVNGQKGLLIRCEEPTASGGHRRSGVLLLWTEGERVLAVQSDMSSEDVLELAQSLR